MLSRTADHLFWMARYTERAEHTARMLDVNLHNSLLPRSALSAERSWRAVLGISELTELFDAKYLLLTPKHVIDFMVRDPDNPYSIFSCLQAARENARAVRGSLTTEVWEIQNTTWLELKRLLEDGALEGDPTEFFEWVKFRSHLSRGVTLGTMLKDDALCFISLGTHLERADNTARILDVKFYEADELREPVETHRDFYHWTTILRSVSAFEIYRAVYRDVITPERVAELMILRRDMPRSLLCCLNEVCANLERVRNDRSKETERRAGMLRSDLHYGRIEDIFNVGLHAYLRQFLERINDLGNCMAHDFLLPPTI